MKKKRNPRSKAKWKVSLLANLRCPKCKREVQTCLRTDAEIVCAACLSEALKAVPRMEVLTNPAALDTANKWLAGLAEVAVAVAK